MELFPPRARAIACAALLSLTPTGCSEKNADATPTAGEAAKADEAPKTDDRAAPTHPPEGATAAAEAGPLDSEHGGAELTIAGGAFGDGDVYAGPFSVSMTKGAFGGGYRELNGQGKLTVPGQPEVTYDLALFVPEGKLAAGEYEGGVDDNGPMGPKSLVTFGLGVGSGDSFHAAYASTAGKIVITAVGKRGEPVRGTLDVTMKEAASGETITVKGPFAFIYVM